MMSFWFVDGDGAPEGWFFKGIWSEWFGHKKVKNHNKKQEQEKREKGWRLLHDTASLLLLVFLLLLDLGCLAVSLNGSR